MEIPPCHQHEGLQRFKMTAPKAIKSHVRLGYVVVMYIVVRVRRRHGDGSQSKDHIQQRQPRRILTPTRGEGRSEGGLIQYWSHGMYIGKITIDQLIRVAYDPKILDGLLAFCRRLRPIMPAEYRLRYDLEQDSETGRGGRRPQVR
jgi:hypothetical protein